MFHEVKKGTCDSGNVNDSNFHGGTTPFVHSF